MKYIEIDLEDHYDWQEDKMYGTSISAHHTENWTNEDIQLYNDLIDFLGIKAPKMNKYKRPRTARKEKKEAEQLRITKRLPQVEQIIILYHDLTNSKGGSHMKRKAMKPKKDKRVFTQTANTTKKINLAPKLARGGIRL